MTDIQKNALIAFHASCNTDGFRDLCFKKHGVDENLSQFNGYVVKATDLFTQYLKEENWDAYVNICASITAFAGAFPEKQIAFKKLIVPLIKVMRDKIDLVRKNSAILLAKLTINEENKKFM